MEKRLTFTNSDSFFNQLFDLESRKEEYFIDTEISEAKDMPLRLLHHIGISKDEVAHVQHKVVEESAWMENFVEPMLIKFNEMIGKYKPAREYEFTIEANDYDTIKIHGRPKATVSAGA